MCRLCWALTLLFMVSTLGLAYVFVVKGETVPASDGRTAILLDAGERDLVLSEMRDFLIALQAISAATAAGDVRGVADAARRVGASAQGGMPPGLVGKLPLGFKRLGFDTHARFDELANNVQDFDSTEPALQAMAELMQNCTGCHAAYRFEVQPQ